MENVKTVLVEAYVVEKVSKKTGNTYKELNLRFPNGYVKERIFLENSELYMIQSLSK